MAQESDEAIIKEILRLDDGKLAALNSNDPKWFQENYGDRIQLIGRSGTRLPSSSTRTVRQLIIRLPGSCASRSATSSRSSCRACSGSFRPVLLRASASRRPPRSEWSQKRHEIAETRPIESRWIPGTGRRPDGITDVRAARHDGAGDRCELCPLRAACRTVCR